MSALALQVLSPLCVDLDAVYRKYIKCILENPCSEDIQFLQCILNKTTVPDEAFSWISENYRSNVKTISCIIKRRLYMDKLIKKVLKALSGYEYNSFSANRIDAFLTESHISLNTYEKNYLFTLLMETKFSSLNFDKLYPFENITKNFKSTESLVHETICNTAYLADCKILKDVIEAAKQNNIEFKFIPETDHKKLFSWLKTNIVKGLTTPDRLGWESGPDSAKWPSINLSDYINTLACLFETL